LNLNIDSGVGRGVLEVEDIFLGILSPGKD
jgi:hypothetical protein